MIIDHIGLVVRSIEKAVLHWKKLFGYEQLTDCVVNTRQKVKVVFLKKEHSITIKLLEPTSNDSPIFQFSQKGGGLHHLCFKCNNLDDEIDRLKGEGVRMLVNPQPGEAFNNNLIAFLFAGNGLNLELIDTEEKAAIL